MTSADPSGEVRAAGDALPAPSSVGRCARCGYSTTGLEAQTCPECGLDLTQTPYLRVADPAWLDRVVLGIALVRYGAGGVLVFLFGGAFIRGTLESIGVGAIVPPKQVVPIVTLLAILVAVVGSFLVSLPDPSLETGATSSRSRRLFQASLAAVAFFVLVRYAVDSSGALSGTPEARVAVMATCSVAAVLASVLCVQGLGKVMDELVRRSERATKKDLTESRLARGWARWVLPVVVLFLVMGWLGGRRGAIAVAKVIDTGVASIGLIGTMFAIVSIMRGSKAIASERDLASAATTPGESPPGGS